MLLETTLPDGTILFIDAPSVGGFSKGASEGNWHPDKALDNVVRIATIVGEKLAEAAALAAGGAYAPDSLELSFGVKVDGAAVVSVSQTPNDGQFRVIARWASSPGE